jgi:hypothetical protein
MEYHVPSVVKFMTKYKRYEPIVQDHSSVIKAKQCKRKYFYNVVLAFKSRGNSPAMNFGSCYHTFREILERSYLESKNEDEAFEKATIAAGDQWKKFGDPPVGAQFDFLTGARLLKSCLVAYDYWKDEKKKGRVEVVAIEQEFIVTLSDGITQIGGRADQIVRWNGKLWGRDFKATSKNAAWYQRLLEPNDQVSRYTLGEGLLTGESIQGQMIELLFNSKKEGPKIIPLTTSRTPQQTERWEKDQLFYNKILTLCRDEDNYPQEEASCPYCDFHSVCKQMSEGAMMATLEQHFEQKPWDFSRSEVIDG